MSSLEKKGEVITEDFKKEFLDRITKKYDSQTDVRYAASRLWVDEIIFPEDTRNRISSAIQTADHQTKMDEFKIGVIQV